MPFIVIAICEQTLTDVAVCMTILDTLYLYERTRIHKNSIITTYKIVKSPKTQEISHCLTLYLPINECNSLRSLPHPNLPVFQLIDTIQLFPRPIFLLRRLHLNFRSQHITHDCYWHSSTSVRISQARFKRHKDYPCSLPTAVLQ